MPLHHDFHSFKELAHFVEEIAVLSRVAVEQAPTAAAFVVYKEQQKRFGHYQPGWDPLTRATMDDRVRHGFSEDDPLLRTGELKKSYEVAFAPGMAGVGSDLPKAEAQEIGNPFTNLPARPTLGPAFVHIEKEAFEASCIPLYAVLQHGRPAMKFTKMTAEDADDLEQKLEDRL